MNARKALTVLLLLVIMLAIAACQTPAGRTTGRAIDDATITTKVKAKLLRDDILGGFAISVKTFNGEVTLVGAVDSKKAKKRAVKLAKSTTGVRKVNNLLKVKKQ